jgi:hypothetical protein
VEENLKMQAEILNDELYKNIVSLVKSRKPGSILEIGSGSGNGSTQAFIEGMDGFGMLFCLEIANQEYSDLLKNTKDYKNVYAYQLSSVPVRKFMTQKDVEKYFREYPDKNPCQYGIDTVLQWLSGTISNVEKTPDKKNHGIGYIKKTHNIKTFDMVLIDGSPFSGSAELKNILGAKIIILDDTEDIKNMESKKTLLKNKKYRLLSENKKLRNGYAIFERI